MPGGVNVVVWSVKIDGLGERVLYPNRLCAHERFAAAEKAILVQVGERMDGHVPAACTKPYLSMQRLTSEIETVP